MSAGNNSLEDAERKRIELDSKVDSHKTQLSYALALLALGISASLALTVAYFNAADDTSNWFFYGVIAALSLALLSLGGVMLARQSLRRDRKALVDAEVAVGILQRAEQGKKSRGWFRRK